MSSKTDKMRSSLRRRNPKGMLMLVMLFQLLSLGMVAFSKGEVSSQTLYLALLVPAATALVTRLMGRMWPVDRAILILVLLLASIGLVTLSAIAKSEITPKTHAIYLAASLVAMLIGAWFIRVWTSWKKFAIPLAVLCILALLSPWVMGSWYQGARNWINIIPGVLTIQPSEFMKPVLIVVLASGFSNHPRFVKCLPWILFAALCCGILLSERDLGAVLLYFLTTIFMYYAATSNVLLSLAGLAAGVGAGFVAYLSFSYVQDRFTIWRNPWSDPQDKGYQLVQALIAIGSGGMWGMGLGQGSPRNIPLYHSDFIFASIAEEFGLVFAVGMLAVYMIIILRGLNITMNARTSFHSLTAFGIVILLGLQTMLIVGGNTKMLPLTGVTLPLVSYGGSSLVSSFFSMGLLLGISSMNTEDEMADIELIEIREVGG